MIAGVTEPMNKPNAFRTYARCVVGGTLYVAVVQFAFLAAIQNPGNPDEWGKARLTDLVQGEGYRPFVYRTLLPTTVRILDGLLPRFARDGMVRAADGFPPLRELFEATPAADEDAPVVYLIAYALEWAALFAFALTLRSAITHFHGLTGWAADLLPLATVAGLPMLYRYITFDYDFPQLFLFTLGFLLLARRRWRWFYPVLMLGAFSKETTVLLVVVHLLGNRGTLRRGAFLGHAAAQLAIVVSVRAWLQFVIFADNPGDPVEVWLARNWEMFSDPGRWGFLFFHFAWVGNNALIVPTNYNVLFLLFAPLVVWKWSCQPLFLRRCIWLLPVQFVLAMVVGQIDEMRVYYESYVLLFLLVAGTLSRLTDDMEHDSPGVTDPSHAM